MKANCFLQKQIGLYFVQNIQLQNDVRVKLKRIIAES
jgi:hypothetical protein